MDFRNTLNSFTKDFPDYQSSRKETSQFGYETFLNTKDYHIIGHKDGRLHDLQVMPNTVSRFCFKGVDDNTKVRARTFWGYNNRRPIASSKYPPNEARFENINKNPTNSSQVRRVPQVTFKKTQGRRELFQDLDF